MRTQVAGTSLEAFHGLSAENYLQPMEIEVMAVFKPGIELTREQIANLLGWKESSVCGRAYSLVKKGRLEEIAGGKTLAGRPAMILRLPVEDQGSLFK